MLNNMTKESIIILGTAHLGTTPGKCSPDKRLKEAVWSREVCKDLYLKLHDLGYKVEIDYEPLNPSADMRGATPKQEQLHELSARVNYVNSLCKKHGSNNCIYVSIHVNAAGADNKWHTAGGFSVYTSVGNTNADKLAERIYERAFINMQGYQKWMEAGKSLGCYDKHQNPYRTDHSDKDSDLESDFYVLKKTLCPAVLVECLFMDNKSDVEFLLSDVGRHQIERTIMEGILDYINMS